jgi:hypothetical protein
LLNPLAQPAEVDISRMRDGRVDEPTRHVTVPPGTWVRVRVSGGPSNPRRPVRALVVDASAPMFAERVVVAGNGVGVTYGTAIG